MCDLIQHKIQALNYWQSSETFNPKCNHCHREIPWGDGFIIDTDFLCNPCGEKLHPSDWIKMIQAAESNVVTVQKPILSK